jgi:oligosaccharyltransferase complex subunit beta
MRWIFLAFALTMAGEVLVLLDSNTYKESHSKFFDSISSRGHKLTIKKVDSQGLRLEKYDEYLYSAIILICPSTDGNL